MKTFEELEQAWVGSPPLSRGRGTVSLVVVRTSQGVHETPAAARLTPEEGVIGDRWKTDDGNPAHQVTMMMLRAAELVADSEQPLHMPGDNLIVDMDLGEEALPAGTRLRVGSAVLEVQAKPHTGCKAFAERFGQDALRWINWNQHRERRLRGVNCRIIETGEVAVGDSIELHSAQRQPFPIPGEQL